MPEPLDEAAELEDVAPDDGADGAAVLVPALQPVLTAPTARVAAAQPATVTRTSSMALPPIPRRLTLLRNAGGNKAALMSADEFARTWGRGWPPMLARGKGIKFDWVRSTR